MDIKVFKELPVMGILRGIRTDYIRPLARAIVDSGLKTIEVTMNTPGAAGFIKDIIEYTGGRLMVGAGTVLTMDDLRQALGAGAGFIVMPTLINDVMSYCVSRSIPVFPGGLTPQEIYSAWRAGASMVKVFPARFFGPEYISEVKGPFKDIELLACGGVNADNIERFFSCGASAVAFGSSIFKKEWLEAGKFSLIGENISNLVKNCPF